MFAQKQTLEDINILELDYSGKVRALDIVAQNMLDIQVEYAKLAGRQAELKAKIEILKQVKSSLQSSIRAESFD